jgi:transcriptional regulator with XRE-family HTH domain
MKKKSTPFEPVNIEQKLKALGAKVKTKRKVINKNYEKFAIENKINKVTLLRIETGDNYKMSSLLQVLNAIGISIEDLLK